MADKIKAVFLDLTGTLYEKGQWLDGAKTTIDWLKSHDIALRFITNTTMKSRLQLQQMFGELGLDVEAESFFTPVVAAVNWFKTRHIVNGILPVVHPDILVDLNGLLLTKSPDADYVLVGDMNNHWRSDYFHLALRALLENAKLTALQMGRRWTASNGHRLDNGPYVVALEYAAEKTCEITFGKPNPVFYELALADCGVKAENAIMIGDDLENDFLAAIECGITGLLVKTGEFKPQFLDHPEVKPEYVLESIKDLPEWIERR